MSNNSNATRKTRIAFVNMFIKKLFPNEKILAKNMSIPKDKFCNLMNDYNNRSKHHMKANINKIKEHTIIGKHKTNKKKIDIWWSLVKDEDTNQMIYIPEISDRRKFYGTTGFCHRLFDLYEDELKEFKGYEIINPFVDIIQEETYKFSNAILVINNDISTIYRKDNFDIDRRMIYVHNDKHLCLSIDNNNVEIISEDIIYHLKLYESIEGNYYKNDADDYSIYEISLFIENNNLWLLNGLLINLDSDNLNILWNSFNTSSIIDDFTNITNEVNIIDLSIIFGSCIRKCDYIKVMLWLLNTPRKIKSIISKINLLAKFIRNNNLLFGSTLTTLSSIELYKPLINITDNSKINIIYYFIILNDDNTYQSICKNELILNVLFLTDNLMVYTNKHEDWIKLPIELQSFIKDYNE